MAFVWPFLQLSRAFLSNQHHNCTLISSLLPEPSPALQNARSAQSSSWAIAHVLLRLHLPSSSRPHQLCRLLLKRTLFRYPKPRAPGGQTPLAENVSPYMARIMFVWTYTALWPACVPPVAPKWVRRSAALHPPVRTTRAKDVRNLAHKVKRVPPRHVNYVLHLSHSRLPSCVWAAIHRARSWLKNAWLAER